MTLQEASLARHAVRAYKKESLKEETVKSLTEELKKINKKGINIQLVLNEEGAFKANKPHYGQFKEVRNYFALVGPSTKEGAMDVGYYGEHMVLIAQSLGLNSCWVGMTYSKTPDSIKIEKNQKLYGLITLGYGETQGTPHKSKKPFEVSYVKDETPPEWFTKGVEEALRAPTALNKQAFTILLMNGKVKLRGGFDFFKSIDMGIVKYHFELGSGKKID